MLVRARASRRSVQRLITNPSMEHLHVDYPPHWYLWLMGVHPAYRRHGVASALARYVTRLADDAGVGCYLETFGDGAEALYRGFGFEVRDHFVIAADAPTGRTMWREPQSLVMASPQS